MASPPSDKQLSPPVENAVSAPAAPTIDPSKVQAADRILKRFAEFAKTVDSFSVTQVSKAQSDLPCEIAARKPNEIAVNYPRWRDGPALTCDGKSVVVIFPARKSCVLSDAPTTLLPLLTDPGPITDKPGLNWYQPWAFFPVLVTINDPAAWLIRFADSYEYVGAEELRGTSADHIRFYRSSSHWDLWLSRERACLPLRLERHDWQPPAVLEFENWRINQQFDAPAFVAQSPPEGYKSHRVLIESEKLIGKTAPNFRLLTIGGKSVTNADYRGKVLLLDFWATTCVPCQQELEILQKIANDYPSQVEILAVTSETKDEVSRFLKVVKRDLPIAFDDSSAVANRYGVSNIPHLVTIDPQGIIQETSVGLESRLDEKLGKLVDKMVLTGSNTENQK